MESVSGSNFAMRGFLIFALYVDYIAMFKMIAMLNVKVKIVNMGIGCVLVLSNFLIRDKGRRNVLANSCVLPNMKNSNLLSVKDGSSYGNKQLNNL